jgi:hypothetical protein
VNLRSPLAKLVGLESARWRLRMGTRSARAPIGRYGNCLGITLSSYGCWRSRNGVLRSRVIAKADALPPTHWSLSREGTRTFREKQPSSSTRYQRRVNTPKRTVAVPLTSYRFRPKSVTTGMRSTKRTAACRGEVSGHGSRIRRARRIRRGKSVCGSGYRFSSLRSDGVGGKSTQASGLRAMKSTVFHP